MCDCLIYRQRFLSKLYAIFTETKNLLPAGPISTTPAIDQSPSKKRPTPATWVNSDRKGKPPKSEKTKTQEYNNINKADYQKPDGM